MDWSRRRFIEATPAALCGVLAAPWPSTAATAADAAEPPVIGRSRRTSKPGDGRTELNLGARTTARILQVTDLHFFGRSEKRPVLSPTDERTLEDFQAYVRVFRPDLLVATGDVWHDNPEGRGRRGLEHAVREFGRLEVPWASCWGNHDQLDDYQAGHDHLEAAPGSHYRGGASHGDYTVDLRSSAAPEPRQLIFLNSHQFGLGAWQRSWLAQNLPPRGAALAFFHIPVLDQKSLYQPGITPGVQGEVVCNEAENGEAAPALARGGVIRACFCGHDHVNDYTVTSHGVGLVYGRATGHSGYGADKVKKGAKLIEFDLATGAWTAVTVFADGSHWKPSV